MVFDLNEPWDEESGSSGSEDPVNDHFVNDDPVNDHFVNDDFVNDDPVNDHFVNDDAVNDEAVNDEAVNDEAVNDDFVNDDVVNDDAVNDDALDDEPAIIDGGFVQKVGNMLNSGGNADSFEVNPQAKGMSFENGDEFAAYCFLYAYKNAFQLFIRVDKLLKKYVDRGVKRHGSGKNQPRFYMMSRIRLCCTWGAEPSKKNGFKDIVNFEKCKFGIDASLKDDFIVINVATLTHNHELKPEMTPHMVSYRLLDEYFKRRALMNDAAGISIAQNFNSLVSEAGGYANLRVNQSDVRNLINLERRRSRINGDAATLEAKFIKLKELDPDFYYAIEPDIEGKLLNVFWADGRCRAMAKSFGAVFSYDATFCVNRYKMPFTPFVGINHHGSSIVLASALISHEDAESFTWVFRRWLDCMGRAPSVILSDQCKGIGKAVKDVFPNSKHRLCLWHILRNATKNLGKLTRYQEINTDLRKIIDDSADSDDFEEAWHHMVTKYNLKENNWIMYAFDNRHSWAPLYWRDTFCAGMSSTQRSEQTNRFFKNYVNVETTLINFLQSYDNALRMKVEHELQLNYASHEKPCSYNQTVIAEEVFQKAYTNSMFREVQAEVYGLIHTNAEADFNIGGFCLYNVRDEVKTPFGYRREKKYVVQAQLDFGEFTCTCKLFEFRGILCRHIIRVLQIKKVQFIPDKYILNQWRKDLVRGYEHLQVGYYNPAADERISRALAITLKNDYIYRMALHDDEAYALYEAESAKIVKALEAHVGIANLNAIGVGFDVTKVWSKRRLQSKENNQRHMIRNAPPPTEGALRDPVDKRGAGRGSRPRQKTVRRPLNVDDDAGPSQPTPRRRRVNSNTPRNTQ
ncbi:protein FAR1-RELATED SEQUENCE 6-like [Silene latifolia]|uniref:protein FAR1-RELATED SEQUENCE 6-like n=1 Tax=Silene latifolia TaxID=37657 RepID=UPI003D786EF5